MRKLVHLILILGLVACGAKDDDEPMGGGGAAGQAGAGSGGTSGEGGESGTSGEGGSDGGTSGQGGDGGSAGTSGEGGAGGEGGMGGEGGGTPVVVPLAQVPSEFAGAICDALDACVGETKLLDLTAREDCETRITAELEAGELAYIDASIGAGRVLYNPAQLEACLEGIRDMGCAVATDTYPEACVEVLAGNVAQGGECTISSECEGTEFCERLACPSTCQPLLDEGDECMADDECGDGMLCLGGTCKALAKDGDACGANSGEVCAFGLSCINFTEDSPGECTPNAEVQAGDVDDECSPTGVLCKEGLSCVPVSAEPEEWRCKEGVGAGGTCLLALPGQCPNDQYCNAEAFFAEGQCVDLPADGDACVLSQLLCAPGFGCVAENDEPVCRRIVKNGESCSGDEACRSRNCVDGECAPPVVCE